MKSHEAFELQRKAVQLTAYSKPVEELLSLGIENPTELDSITRAIGAPSFLVNLHMATRISLNGESALHLPVQVSNSERGRPSLYYQEPNQPVLAGYIVLPNFDVWQRIVTRKTGKGKARSGDVYETELRKLNGELVAHWRGRLKIIDGDKGYGQLITTEVLAGGVRPNKEVWIAWSFIYVKD